VPSSSIEEATIKQIAALNARSREYKCSPYLIVSLKTEGMANTQGTMVFRTYIILPKIFRI